MCTRSPSTHASIRSPGPYGGTPETNSSSRSAMRASRVMLKRAQTSSTVASGRLITHGTSASSRCRRPAALASGVRWLRWGIADQCLEAGEPAQHLGAQLGHPRGRPPGLDQGDLGLAMLPGGGQRLARVEAFRHLEVGPARGRARSEEHTSELQSLAYLVCRLLLEKKKKKRCKYTVLKNTQTNKNQ